MSRLDPSQQGQAPQARFSSLESMDLYPERYGKQQSATEPRPDDDDWQEPLIISRATGRPVWPGSRNMGLHGPCAMRLTPAVDGHVSQVATTSSKGQQQYPFAEGALPSHTVNPARKIRRTLSTSTCATVHQPSDSSAPALPDTQEQRSNSERLPSRLLAPQAPTTAAQHLAMYSTQEAPPQPLIGCSGGNTAPYPLLPSHRSLPPPPGPNPALPKDLAFMSTGAAAAGHAPRSVFATTLAMQGLLPTPLQPEPWQQPATGVSTLQEDQPSPFSWQQHLQQMQRLHPAPQQVHLMKPPPPQPQQQLDGPPPLEGCGSCGPMGVGAPGGEGGEGCFKAAAGLSSHSAGLPRMTLAPFPGVEMDGGTAPSPLKRVLSMGVRPCPSPASHTPTNHTAAAAASCGWTPFAATGGAVSCCPSSPTFQPGTALPSAATMLGSEACGRGGGGCGGASSGAAEEGGDTCRQQRPTEPAHEAAERHRQLLLSSLSNLKQLWETVAADQLLPPQEKQSLLNMIEGAFQNERQQCQVPQNQGATVSWELASPLPQQQRQPSSVSCEQGCATVSGGMGIAPNPFGVAVSVSAAATVGAAASPSTPGTAAAVDPVQQHPQTSQHIRPLSAASGLPHRQLSCLGAQPGASQAETAAAENARPVASTGRRVLMRTSSARATVGAAGCEPGAMTGGSASGARDIRGSGNGVPCASDGGGSQASCPTPMSNMGVAPTRVLPSAMAAGVASMQLAAVGAGRFAGPMAASLGITVSPLAHQLAAPLNVSKLSCATARQRVGAFGGVEPQQGARSFTAQWQQHAAGLQRQGSHARAQSAQFEFTPPAAGFGVADPTAASHPAVASHPGQSFGAATAAVAASAAGFPTEVNDAAHHNPRLVRTAPLPRFRENPNDPWVSGWDVADRAAASGSGTGDAAKGTGNVGTSPVLGVVGGAGLVNDSNVVMGEARSPGSRTPLHALSEQPEQRMQQQQVQPLPRLFGVEQQQGSVVGSIRQAATAARLGGGDADGTADMVIGDAGGDGDGEQDEDEDLLDCVLDNLLQNDTSLTGGSLGQEDLDGLLASRGE